VRCVDLGRLLRASPETSDRLSRNREVARLLPGSIAMDRHFNVQDSLILIVAEPPSKPARLVRGYGQIIWLWSLFPVRLRRTMGGMGCVIRRRRCATTSSRTFSATVPRIGTLSAHGLMGHEFSCQVSHYAQSLPRLSIQRAKAAVTELLEALGLKVNTWPDALIRVPVAPARRIRAFLQYKCYKA
jgi:hypothetical protein